MTHHFISTFYPIYMTFTFKLIVNNAKPSTDQDEIRTVWLVQPPAHSEFHVDCELQMEIKGGDGDFWEIKGSILS